MLVQFRPGAPPQECRAMAGVGLLGGIDSRFQLCFQIPAMPRNIADRRVRYGGNTGGRKASLQTISAQAGKTPAVVPGSTNCTPPSLTFTIFHTSTDDCLNLAAEPLAGMTRVTFPCDTDWHRFAGPR